MPSTPRRGASKAPSKSPARGKSGVGDETGVSTGLLELKMDPVAEKKFEWAVEDLKFQISQRPADKKMSIKKKSPSHQIHNTKWKDKCHRVDVSKFNDIIGFKSRTRATGEPAITALCGGQVQMGELCKKTIPLGYVPKVVPEYSNFTVAGLINGEGIQTSSYKHGVFTHSVLSMTVVLGNGEVIVCDDHQHTDLLTHMPESYGTLGIVIAAEVELTPCLPYVSNTYTLFSDRHEYVTVFDKKTREGKGAYLEGLVMSRDQYLLIESDFVNSKDGLHDFDPSPDAISSGGQWHHQYIEKDVVGGKKSREVKIQRDVMPLYSYLFRYMRGSWWMTEMILGLPYFTGKGWFRKMVDEKTQEAMDQYGGFANIPSRMTMEETQRCYVLQDMGIKMNRLEEGIKFVQDTLGVYPLWLCSVNGKYNRRLGPEWRHLYNDRFVPNDPENLFCVDMGIYGEPTVQPFYHKKMVKAIQEFVDFPSGWGVSYEDPAAIRERHRPMREKYHAQDVFPGVEEKITFKGKKDALDEKDEGPIFAWRWYKEYGPYWPIKVGSFCLVFFGGLGYLLVLLWNYLLALYSQR